ncbi:TrkA C-terminal domain-containing protein [Clostridium sp. LIBA-8841]|uniref:TrkA C-terminal domain-containing protein n=1 Tax=Clostridium sp. LIBA-8841 TaxID=2987530 RepID=UPI002AC55228|nr:TrkA C-terminal domain-containing protein [Clostridium sp. LIBA-8841]MDZ5254318.1 TrkA C-terminal domain-containing protein [Clostridium sp. LIBA-8841]
MVLVLTFILFLMIFLIIVDFFAILFRLTGVPIEKARFQVTSLLTGTGFTTKESEIIVQHPTRRKLAIWLMGFSYASTATIISFAVNIITSSVIDVGSIAIIVLFIVFILFFHKSSLLEKLENKIEKFIVQSKIWDKLNSKHLTLITHTRGFGVYEIYLSSKTIIIGKSIRDSGLKPMEIEVLNIDKGDKFINFPTPDYVFETYDKITVYGNLKNIKSMFEHINEVK